MSEVLRCASVFMVLFNLVGSVFACFSFPSQSAGFFCGLIESTLCGFGFGRIIGVVGVVYLSCVSCWCDDVGAFHVLGTFPSCVD